MELYIKGEYYFKQQNRKNGKKKRKQLILRPRILRTLAYNQILIAQAIIKQY